MAKLFTASLFLMILVVAAASSNLIGNLLDFFCVSPLEYQLKKKYIYIVVTQIFCRFFSSFLRLSSATSWLKASFFYVLNDQTKKVRILFKLFWSSYTVNYNVNHGQKICGNISFWAFISKRKKKWGKRHI